MTFRILSRFDLPTPFRKVNVRNGNLKEKIGMRRIVRHTLPMNGKNTISFSPNVFKHGSMPDMVPAP